MVESSFYEDGDFVTITQVNVRGTGAHHLDIINLGEASDKYVHDDHSGGVSVVGPRGPDPGVIHLGVHQCVQDPFLHLPGKEQKSFSLNYRDKYIKENLCFTLPLMSYRCQVLPA